MGQGEVLMLRLGVGLPVSAVADVVGTDALAIRRSEARGLERLGVDRELLTWSLAAPASAAELADERVVSGAYRSLPRPTRARVGPGIRVVALAPVASSRPYVASRRDRSARAAGVVGLSRTAMIGAVAVSASVMSLGGISAAAYVGVLPDPIQSILHDALGAPAPRSDRPGSGSGGTDPRVPGQQGQQGHQGQGAQNGTGGAGVKGPKSAQPGSSPTVNGHPVTPGKGKSGADHTAVPPSSTHSPATGRPTKTTTKAPAKSQTNTHSTGKPSASQVDPTASTASTASSTGETARGTGSGSKPTAPPKGSPSPKKGG
jgi:hypothetical protein